MRLRNIPEAQTVVDRYHELVRTLDYFDLKDKKFAFDGFFPNEQPLHLELGMGRGLFITTLAARNPRINYLGIDQFTSVVYKALLKIKEAPLVNLRFLILDINNLHFLLAENTVERIYLNFSDPWPAKGKARKRLTSAKKLKMYKKFLKSGGEIFFKTDNEALFEFSLNQLAEEGFKLKNITFDLHNSEFAADNIMTEYEIRFSRQGKKIYRVEASYCERV